MATKGQKFKKWTAEENTNHEKKTSYGYHRINEVFKYDIDWDNNNYRPSFASQYKNPVEYRTQLGFK